MDKDPEEGAGQREWGSMTCTVWKQERSQHSQETSRRSKLEDGVGGAGGYLQWGSSCMMLKASALS